MLAKLDLQDYALKQEKYFIQGSNEIMMDLRFKDFIKYISMIDRISICMQDTLQYENYRRPEDIPKGKYDDYFVFGGGVIESEFEYDIEHPEPREKENHIYKNVCLMPCIEIRLSIIPRDEYYRLEREKELAKGDNTEWFDIEKTKGNMIMDAEQVIGKRYTWEQIKRMFPNQWVGLVDVKWKSGAIIESGVLKYTDKTASELMKLQLTTEPDLHSGCTTSYSGLHVGRLIRIR